jgi:HEAT repeat protein
MSVEESYLQESVENMIIREQSRAESREMKMIALEYIGDALTRGNHSDEIRQALEYMGLEGVLNQGRENGRLINNYPDVRRETAKYLGQMGTPEAKDALLKMIYYDNEPMVLQEAVKSLADIGNDDNGRTISTIAWIVQKFDNTNPDNLLALSAIEAFEKLGAANGGLKDPNAIQMIIRIADGPYIRPVQDRAKQALVNIRKAQAQAQKQQQEQQQRQ